jgi:hypothetical protein
MVSLIEGMFDNLGIFGLIVYCQVSETAGTYKITTGIALASAGSVVGPTGKLIAQDTTP